MSAPLALFRRDLRLARHGGGTLLGVLFLSVVIALLPLGVGPDLPLLRRIGPGVLWVGALLANLLTLDRLLAGDYEDGTLDLMRLSSGSLELALSAKACAHWLTSGLPVVLAALVLSTLLGMDLPEERLAVAATLLAGTPALTFLGLIGAALSVSLRRGALLSSVLVMPLCVPVLIFGTAATTAAGDPLASFWSPFAVLCGLTLASIALAPIAAAAAVRHGLDE